MALLTIAAITAAVKIEQAYKRIDAMRFDQPGRVYVALNTYGSSAEAKNGGRPILPLEEHGFSVAQFATDEAKTNGKENISLAKAYELVKETAANKDAADA